MDVDFHPGYRLERTPFGKRYIFFCGLSGAEVCAIGPVRGKNPHQTLEAAKGKARLYFNRCPECGRWVCDNAFNMDVCKCAECAPFQRTPHFCTACGAPLKTGADCCLRCGSQIGGRKDAI